MYITHTVWNSERQEFGEQSKGESVVRPCYRGDEATKLVIVSLVGTAAITAQDVSDFKVLCQIDYRSGDECSSRVGSAAELEFTRLTLRT